ncbi:sulfate ABC transporter permease subunit CysW [Thermoleptolyngbya oregonensis NK1-22]|uniref:Sulfate ABC transporter permease subunit CysW n=1 Tax=Thermoleptolyngbya oregonensis NK1-22 TaxID=2547457 RepID=A0AA96Y978_9CYAN|nr:sulfate ABC transporter permease subunit CysW [Thermoleptolyngbya sp. M55_K2018_002]WOB43433.1 sulfate ABC transporter permease subunit CysW [Thermoleptolyngbya oregonensis NK1-22]HIK42997.1 sulfate ABC transporter permease subunit CysW [Thermoleptolyngbya sp. M55_K2018_002]
MRTDAELFNTPDASSGRRVAPRSQGAWVKWVLIGIAVLYLTLILFIPALNVFVQAFRNGLGPFFSNLVSQPFLNAVKLTLLIAAIALPINTIFGLCAAWAIARHQFPGRTLLLSIIDIPFAISPVVAGLMIVLLYGRNGWFGPWLQANDLRIIFAVPGMVLATMFVTMPFVAREVIPVLEEAGTDQEEAAKTLGASDWQTFWRVTLPNIRWGLLYGLILTNARAMGEFGAVSVVSGNIIGKTQTLPLYVEEAYKQYKTPEAYSAAVLLAFLAVITLVLKEIVERKTRIKDVEE